MKNEKNTAQEDLSNLSVRRRQEMTQQAEDKKRRTLYWVIGIVVAILVAALLIWDSGLIQRSAAAYKVGSYGFSVNDVNFYYFNSYNQVASYASYYGLDTSLPLDEQEYEEGVTWKEHLMEQAKSSMQEVALLCTDAQSNGYTLSDEGKQTVEDNYQAMADAAANYGLTDAAYLNYAYGRFMTPSAYKKALTQQQLAVEYAQHMQDSYGITEEDMTAYYEENAATIDEFDYNAYYVSLGLTPEYDDEGNQKDYDADALAAAQQDASAKAEEMKTALASGNEETISAKATELSLSDLSSTGSSMLSYYPFGEWVTDSSRKAGDVDIVESTATDSNEQEYVDGYYVVRFNSRSLDEYYGANFYNLLVQAEAMESEAAGDAENADAETEADETAATEYDWDAAKAKIDGLQEQWLSGDATAESFLAMAQENTDGSTTEYTSVGKGEQNAEVDEWLFGQEHQAGDYAIVEDQTLHGYRLVYFTGYDDLYLWQVNAKNAISSQRYEDWLEQAKEGLTTSETAFFSQVG